MADPARSAPDAPGILRVPFPDLVERLSRTLRNLSFEPDHAALCARLFSETTRDGVYSHGLRRFPRFAAMVRNAW